MGIENRCVSAATMWNEAFYTCSHLGFCLYKGDMYLRGRIYKLTRILCNAWRDEIEKVIEEKYENRK